MKNTLTILLLVCTLFITQACGSKTENSNEESAASETPVVDSEVTTVAERRVRIEKERMELEEKRRIEFEERVKINPTFTDAKGKIVYNKAEVAPSFTGGEKEMMNYLRNSVQFPAEAQAKGLEGTVFVDFIVNENGSVREVEVKESTSEAVDQSFRTEAVRVVTAMPK